ncbi:hypothetical protein ONZ43_g468 [Nemania bipapillata]|uniref:Uncharacterized protein n=1 Tax=Nemania bipapillata TaxID=110536 RepID=A0ACC2J876_9PEZI|nr:hypothetical protein ONZ43_g468 [Nemania bipapillata]
MLETCTTKEADKSKAFLKEFRKDVKRKDMELSIFRQKKEQDLQTSTKGQEKISTIFRQLSQQFGDGQGGRLSTLRMEDHPLFKLAQANKEDHQLLLKQFKLVEEQLDTNKLELPAVRWKQDKQEIKEFLDCGSSPIIDQANVGEEDWLAKEFFNGSRELLDGETWGHVAEEQLKHFSAIARTVQLEEER